MDDLTSKLSTYMSVPLRVPNPLLKRVTFPMRTASVIVQKSSVCTKSTAGV